MVTAHDLAQTLLSSVERREAIPALTEAIAVSSGDRASARFDRLGTVGVARQ